MSTQEAKYALRPMTVGDLPTVLEWRNQEHIRHAMYTDHLISADEHAAWFDRVSADPGNRQFIFDVEGRPVGVVSFSDIDTVNRRARWGFYLGVSDVPPRTGSRMTFHAVAYAFEVLHLHKLAADTFSFNGRARGLFNKFGFVEEGVLRQQFLKDGAFEDVVVLGMLASEWAEHRDAMRGKLFGRNGE